jgi:hypothetical protein
LKKTEILNPTELFLRTVIYNFRRLFLKTVFLRTAVQGLRLFHAPPPPPPNHHLSPAAHLRKILSGKMKMTEAARTITLTLFFSEFTLTFFNNFLLIFSLEYLLVCIFFA